jgi:hypothetical protein
VGGSAPQPASPQSPQSPASPISPLASDATTLPTSPTSSTDTSPSPVTSSSASPVSSPSSENVKLGMPGSPSATDENVILINEFSSSSTPKGPIAVAATASAATATTNYGTLPASSSSADHAHNWKHPLRAVAYAFLGASCGAWTNLMGKSASELIRASIAGEQGFNRWQVYYHCTLVPLIKR